MKLMVDKDRVPHPQAFVFEFASVEERDACSREISRLLTDTKSSTQPAGELASSKGAGKSPELGYISTCFFLIKKQKQRVWMYISRPLQHILFLFLSFLNLPFALQGSIFLFLVREP